MRVALISGGTYPYRDDAVATWCHRLSSGLDEHTFHRVVVTDPEPGSAGLPSGPAWRPSAMVSTRGSAVRRRRREATHAALLLCRGMLEHGPHGSAMFRSALHRLATIAADGTPPLDGIPLAPLLLDAWRADAGPPATVGRLTGRSPSTGLPWPALRDAQIAGRLLERAVRALCTPVPDVELCHVADGGLATLVALGVKWRRGIPYVLSEHDVYLRTPLMERSGGRPAVRAILLRFLRALARLGYAEAAAVALPSDRMRRWAVRHGAGRDVLRVVPHGVDPRDHPQLRDEPDEPVMVWVGPDDELPQILAAFAALGRTVPGARLVVAGPPAPGPRPDGVSFTGPATSRREAYALGRIVVISGAHRSMPYPLIEAMLSGRPTVCSDSGGLAAMVGMAGLVAPPGDPGRLAAACASLLTDRRLRRELATAARHRARTLFALNAMIDGFRTEYARVASARYPEPAPAARSGVPA